MNKQDYLDRFPEDKRGEAIKHALDIRKFEIDLYWKRATYFWTFIAAAFAGYGLSSSKEVAEQNPSLILVFACLGFLFSLAWYLVNRGSKFWQNNWERHVDLLEDETIGSLYKTIIQSEKSGNFLTSERQYSVSKINQILSFFITIFWLLLIAKTIFPISCARQPDFMQWALLALTLTCAICLMRLGKSDSDTGILKIKLRSVDVVN